MLGTILGGGDTWVNKIDMGFVFTWFMVCMANAGMYVSN